MRSRRSDGIAPVCAVMLMVLSGCASGPPRWGPHGNALDFVTPYFSKLEAQCGRREANSVDGPIELRFLGQKRPPNARTTSDTDDWRLTGCGREMNFILDCGDGAPCRESTWPTPLAVLQPDRNFDALVALVDAAPQCEGAIDLELVITLRSSVEPTNERVYLVERCGVDRRFRVECQEDRSCVVTDATPPP